MIRQLVPGENDGLIAGTVQIYAQAFEHLMFDRDYFDALRRCQRTGTISDSLAGTEKFRVGDTCPIVPGCLTPELREQWIEDFTALTSYALEKGLGVENDLPQPLGVERTPEDLLVETIRNLGRVTPKSRQGQQPPTVSSPTPPTKADAQRDMNKQLYQANKELASANTSIEARLDRVKATLGSLTTKIEDKIGEKLATSEPVERVSNALRLLLLSGSEDNDEEKGRF
ncbi:hypothetical protein AAVH_27358 [Aphelenchoides avenae]|nr:hypothetical protein AAVH_27358 [Aphelenchus avenae]